MEQRHQWRSKNSLFNNISIEKRLWGEFGLIEAFILATELDQSYILEEACCQFQPC